MGWDFGWEKKRDLIAELKKGALASHRAGQVLWTVQKTSDGTCYIVCHLLARSSANGERVWGVKSMDETMGPSYYTCPVEWFDTYPCPPGRYAAEWRASVRARQEREIAHAEELAMLSAGFDRYGKVGA